jgi:hypothetical protein
MREVRASILHITLFGTTRIMLGVGLGLLLSDRVRRRNRKSLGALLAAIGGLTTIPFALGVRRMLRAQRIPKTELDGVHVPIRERLRDFEMAETAATD